MKRKVGRPKTKTKQTARTRISVTLTAYEKKILKEAGDGSVSAGITRMINRSLEFGY